MRKFSKIISMRKGEYNKETIAKKNAANVELTPWEDGGEIIVGDE